MLPPSTARHAQKACFSIHGTRGARERRVPKKSITINFSEIELKPSARSGASQGIERKYQRRVEAYGLFERKYIATPGLNGKREREVGKHDLGGNAAVAARPAILFENAFSGNSRKSGCSPKASHTF